MSRRQAVVDSAGRHVFNLEDRIDDAFEAAGRFASDLTTLRRDANLSAIVGQEVYAASARMAGYLASARGEAVAIHNAMEALRVRHRIGTLSIAPPDGEKPPPHGFAAADATEAEIA